jgi:hypothetical protein
VRAEIGYFGKMQIEKKPQRPETFWKLEITKPVSELFSLSPSASLCLCGFF